MSDEPKNREEQKGQPSGSTIGLSKTGCSSEITSHSANHIQAGEEKFPLEVSEKDIMKEDNISDGKRIPPLRGKRP